MIDRSNLPALAGLLLQTLLVAVALLLAWTFIVRRRLDRRKTARDRIHARWRPILGAAMTDPDVDLPPLPAADAAELLRLWTYLLETVRGESAQRLVEAGRRLGLLEAARRMLIEGGRERVLVAVSALGHLHDRDALPDLRRLVDDPAPSVSFAAARAVVRVDGPDAMPALLPDLLARWHGAPSRVAQVLHDSGSKAATASLLALVRSRDTPELAEAVRLLEPHATSETDAVVLALLQDTTDPDVLRACLKVVRSPQAGRAARDLLAHDDWVVRVEACNTLSRIGTDADAEALTRCLGDREWWVRYRASQALRSIPSVGDDGLRAAAEASGDSFARDMAQQVLAEEGGP